MESYIEVSMLDDMINPSNAGRVYIQDPNFGHCACSCPSTKGARPSADTVLITKVDMFSSMFST